MSPDLSMGIGIGLLSGSFLVSTVWYLETLFSKALWARRARRAFDVSLDQNAYPVPHPVVIVIGGQPIVARS